MARVIAGNRAGSATLPICLSIAALIGAAIAILGLRLKLRHDVETQRRIDRCVQRRARALVRLQDRLEEINLAMIAARATLETAPAPPVIIAAESVLNAGFIAQEILLATYRFESARWLVRRGCDGRRDLPLPLPTLRWRRDPPDRWGVQPLEWDGDRSEDVLRITLASGRRVSHARLRAENAVHWRADWSSPAAGSKFVAAGESARSAISSASATSSATSTAASR